MYSIHYLVCVLVVIVFQCYCDDIPDEPMAINDQIFGEGNTCDFTFEGYTPEDIVQYIYPHAKFYGVGHLPKHRLDFTVDAYYITAVPDDNEEIWGIVSIVSKEEYQTYAGQDKDGHVVVKTVEVKVNDQLLKVDCNLNIANDQPEKVTPLPENRRPTQTRKDHLVDVCVKYAFPQTYCDKLRNLPAKQC